ncbi:MAG: hypothetical protein Q8P81_03930 [Nanoarchaeota archaeon]|nr:hypothetical protein [Nanoarchaeota archaeon]
MALRHFETADAEYYLGLGSHSRSSAPIFKDINFSDLDFMVFEDGGTEEDKDGFSLRRGLSNHPQYEGVYRKIETENPDLPIYGVDVRVSIRDVMSAVGVLSVRCLPFSKCLVGYFLTDSVSTGDLAIAGSLFLPELMTYLESFTSRDRGFTLPMSLLTNILPMPLTSYRDAVTAKKVSEYLVPKHKQAGRKVKTGLLYGAMHSGMELKIKHPQIANATTYFYHNILRRKFGEELNQIRRIQVNGSGNLETVMEDCGLFR